MILRLALVSLLGTCLAGCAIVSPPAANLDPNTAANDLAARSLQDPGLNQFLTANIGRGANSAPLDFETLNWIAFYFHPSLGVARAQWSTARAAEATAAQRPNPGLTLTPGYNTTREPGISPWFPSINLDFLLPASGRRVRQQDLAKAESEAARLNVLVAAWQVRTELRRALADATATARRAEILRAQLDAQKALTDLFEQRFAAGGATASELSTARAGLLKTESTATEALGQSTTAKVKVATALGMPATALKDVTLPQLSDPPSLSAEALRAARHESLRSRADILAALAKYQSSQAALEVEIARQKPDFHLGPGYQWDQGANKWSLAVSFELPVFHRNEAAIAEAVARRSEAVAQFNLVQTQAVAAIDSAVAAQETATRQLEHARRLRAELEQQKMRVQQRVDLGAADQLELQLARVESASADSVILEAESAGLIAAGQLEDAPQIPFPHLASIADASRLQASTPP